jgi:alcohol dehydrogenase class IV
MTQRFYLPTEVITGCGSLDQLGGAVARLGSSALLVCGRHAAQASGVLERAMASLRQANVRPVVFDGVQGEATLSAVAAAMRQACDENCQVFVGLGGGSAIDVAKAAAGLVHLPGTLREYHNGRALEEAGLPFVAVPTTSGTGAEVTKNAVLIDEESGVKNSIRDDSWFARVAIVDPETTLSMPPAVTASTGADALCQAIEAYTSTGASPVTDALAMSAIHLIGLGLLPAYRDGQDLAAREQMSMGSLMAGMAMASARLGGVHGLAHPLGVRYAIPHGLVCGLLLPYTMHYNLAYATRKYARVAQLLGEITNHLTPEAAAEKAVGRVRHMLRKVGIVEHLASLGVQRADFDWIIAESLPSGSLKSNPRPLAAEDVRCLLEAAL